MAELMSSLLIIEFTVKLVSIMSASCDIQSPAVSLLPPSTRMLCRIVPIFVAAIFSTKVVAEWIAIKHKVPNVAHYQLTTTQLPQFNQTMTTQNVESLQELLLTVHRSLIRESNQPLYKRLSFLRNLKFDLLHRMWAECHDVWTKPASIQGRTHMSHKKHFPSLEAALLTISFLTFAVFLIKVVQQFIQGMQAMNGNGVMQVTPAKVVKHKRETEYMNLAARILHYIKDFQTGFTIYQIRCGGQR
ncbi:uncharacterized protein isoform X2 [Rhodnius prolixus]